MLSNGRIAAVGMLIAIAVVPAQLAAQDPLPQRGLIAPTVRAARGTIRVDGRLDDVVYGTTDAIGSFVQQEPDEGKPATERTEAWVFFDDDMIYVAARCWESRPERRVANEMRRDANQLRQNDTFAVLFDTFHDRRNGYLFTANAIGGMGDSQITDEGPPNVDWNTVWTFETGEFDGGWTVEMAIPFKSLRYQSGREQTWGINLRRVVRWKNEWSYLAQVPRALTTFRGILKVSSAATLVGLQVPSGTRMIELKPYALSGLATDTTVTPRLSNDVTKRVGGDLKYGVTQNLTADVRVCRTRERRPRRRQWRHALSVFQSPDRSRQRAGSTASCRRTIERQSGPLHDGSAQRSHRRPRAARRPDARYRSGHIHRRPRQARHPAPQQHRRHGHPSERHPGSGWLESRLRPRRDVLVLSERAL
jgi:hypothetical protein